MNNSAFLTPFARELENAEFYIKRRAFLSRYIMKIKPINIVQGVASHSVQSYGATT